MKSLILVTSPPACGKTYVSKAIAKKLDHVVYLDKDTLIVLSKQIFKVANQEYNRSSDFFEENIISLPKIAKYTSKIAFRIHNTMDFSMFI